MGGISTQNLEDLRLKGTNCLKADKVRNLDLIADRINGYWKRLVQALHISQTTQKRGYHVKEDWEPDLFGGWVKVMILDEFL